MKKYSIYTMLLMITALLSSCKKSDLQMYDGERSLYFSPKLSPQSLVTTDSIPVNFTFSEDEVTDSILKIPIKLLGRQLNTPATFNVGVDNQTTTAIKNIDFEIAEQFNFAANKSTDTVSLKIFRTGKLSNKEYIIGLELLQSKDFNTNLFGTDLSKSSSRKVKIYISDILKPTPGWEPSSTSEGASYYLGKFSKKKMQLIVLIFDGMFSFDDLYYKAWIDDLALAYLASSNLNYYLLEQEMKGTPVLEKDGTPMKLGPFYD